MIDKLKIGTKISFELEDSLNGIPPTIIRAVVKDKFFRNRVVCEDLDHPENLYTLYPDENYIRIL